MLCLQHWPQAFTETTVRTGKIYIMLFSNALLALNHLQQLRSFSETLVVFQFPLGLIETSCLCNSLWQVFYRSNRFCEKHRFCFQPASFLTSVSLHLTCYIYIKPVSLHLSTVNFMCRFLAHSLSIVRFVCIYSQLAFILTALNNFLQSGSFVTLLFSSSFRSFIKH